jgi:shikimate dehydrogenase
MTDSYAVIGNPIAHSKSPIIHAAFARETNQSLRYDALYADIPDFEAAVMRFRDAGGCGLNVTVPFKHRAHAIAARLSARASDALAVNTLTFGEDGIRGDNTDGAGLIRDLTINLGCKVAEQRVLVMGAGGAAFGMCGPLLEQAPRELIVANRSVDKAVALCARFKAVSGRTMLRGCAYEELDGMQFDVVVNATSASLDGAMPPLPKGVFGPGALAYETVYGKVTPFMRAAEREGARTCDGTGMLVEQAAESFYIWRGVRPQTGPVIELLRDLGK